MSEAKNISLTEEQRSHKEGIAQDYHNTTKKIKENSVKVIDEIKTAADNGNETKIEEHWHKYREYVKQENEVRETFLDEFEKKFIASQRARLVLAANESQGRGESRNQSAGCLLDTVLLDDK
ncbi:unnamed protein product [Didymodactylos carnosus]|uniref:Uncharacterized protein n=1 Tax=Didymodactylos carnosus TaxID=1234261 RepID=A0A815Q1R9_9BILA|nr:unnamed protein product [Didymodactylos carnosus]CAF4328317.1 unnamed protein product [Didymodactylos carnosus]